MLNLFKSSKKGFEKMSAKSTFALRSLKSEAGLFYKTQTLCFKLDLTKTQGFGGLGPLLINA